MRLISWIGLALLGIVIAAAVSVAASRLASQQIGLASEPISAGDALAPAQRKHRDVAAQRHKPKGHAGAVNPNPPSAPIQPTTPITPAPSPPAEEAEPSHASGDGEHGRGADD